jgi:hypothetical protein
MGTAGTAVLKDIYLGLDLAAPESGFTGLEFSIDGLRSDTEGILVTGVFWSVPPGLIIGDIHAPVDTAVTSTGLGGMNVAWAQCQVGSQTVARIQFLFFTPRVDHVLVVKRKYPTSNPLYRAPIFTRCNFPDFTAVRVTSACYVLNWTGDPAVISCLDGPVGVEPRTWTGMKSLFR